MVKEFTVLGEPKGKGRPRFNPKICGSKPRTPEQTLVYENLIGWEYRRQCNGCFPEKVPVVMEITEENGKFFMKRERPVKKPDLDNVVKVYADALNQLAYHDDSQIVTIVCKKYYSDRPRVEVRLSDMGGDNEIR